MADLSYPVAFGAGVLSFFTPCVLPMVPVYLANLAGATATGLNLNSRIGSRHALLHTLSFVLGFSLIFAALGLAAGVFGGTLAASGNALAKVGGGVVFIFGVLLIAALWIPWLNYEQRLQPKLGHTPSYGRSLLIGSVFSLGWTPCIGPILGAILTVAWSAHTAWYGASLLGAYSLGLGVPFVTAGLLIGIASPLWRRLNRYSIAVSVGSGGLLMVLGVLMFTGNFTLISQTLMNIGS